ncbi:MAG: hypothetical protein IPH11_12065 [Ignavibacteriales bacterium]|nr:hypothetical protein [Ignavibacteriales bacterium]
MALTISRLAPTLPCCPDGGVVGNNRHKVTASAAGVNTLFFVVGQVIFILSGNFLPVLSILKLIFAFFSILKSKINMA